MLTFFRNTLPKGLAVVFPFIFRPNLEKCFQCIEEKHCKDGVWDVETTVLLKLLFCFKQHDFDHYTIEIGKQVDVNTGFKNAEDVARRLRRIRQLIKDDGILPDKLISSYRSPYTRTIDAFLTTNLNESVDINEFLDEVKDSIIDLHYLLLSRSDSLQVPLSYYQRATRGVLGDLYTILEGLLTAALMR